MTLQDTVQNSESFCQIAPVDVIVYPDGSYQLQLYVFWTSLATKSKPFVQ